MSTPPVKDDPLSVPPGVVIPPLRFSVVEDKLYRGSYPRPLNFEFLESLRLKTILSLTEDPLNEAAAGWCWSRGIDMVHICPEGGSKKEAPLRHPDAIKILQIILDNTRGPLYVHCLNGSEVTGLAMASLRKVQLWATPAIVSEMMRFSETHSSSFDLFLEEFVGPVTIPKTPTNWLWQGIAEETGFLPHISKVHIQYENNAHEHKSLARTEATDNTKV
ncbi:hypothetical protein L873DRAFT_1763082 [Choiromyces venosus 120613-1]|uniref:Protein-tyrosine phosphatase n=1 Tax=Choiromyces venosus 120613-1 TaxID=1336337 RepID=A0A3N4JYA4_9PEZI|nr:hypothetical protein L873DRAFT_1763082 [Choiromyces venosus 120613-1]